MPMKVRERSEDSKGKSILAVDDPQGDRLPGDKSWLQAVVLSNYRCIQNLLEWHCDRVTPKSFPIEKFTNSALSILLSTGRIEK